VSWLRPHWAANNLRLFDMLMNNFQLTLFHRVEPYFASSIEKGLKELLEAKHLYQNTRIEPPDKNVVHQEMKPILAGDTSIAPQVEVDETIDFVYSSLSKIEWKIRNPRGRRSLRSIPTQSEDIYVSLEFTPPTVKLYCRICKRTEAYNFQYGQDLLKEFRGAEIFTEPVNEQVFSLVYQCQSCKSIPEIFMVRRDSLKLIQSGRTPMEKIEIPPYLPRKRKKFFSDAVIAFNSGQVLAGNFLLRTFVEQYVRDLSANPNSQNIDELFSEYNKGLPDDLKQRFPSLQSIYYKLSEDLHSATASEEVFFQARKDIEKHFKARELFEL